MGTIRDSVEEYVSEQLRGYELQRIRAPKVIHDTILGSNLFHAHEIEVLDLPIIQRLRRISQVDLAPLVFPSGNHNRFEHTMGVAVIAEKIANSIKRVNTDLIDLSQIYHLRMAAILHDCGHGPFSHISEEIYKHYDDLLAEKEKNPRLAGSSAHETLSYLIITSQSIKQFFVKIGDQYEVDFDLNFIGDMVVGYVEDPQKAYLIDIINGAFDADKLDYIQRDSHFTGIKMALDLERLFYAMEVIKDKEGYMRLSVDISGVSTLEQIVFNKMMLFTNVYHHHKVRAAECLFRSIFDESKNCGQVIEGLDFSSAAHFLNISDVDIYGLARGDKASRRTILARYLSIRQLPKRAMVLSTKTVAPHSLMALQGFMEVYESPKKARLLAEAISEASGEMGQFVSSDDIWVDIRGGPKFKEAINWPIKSPGSDGGYIRLRDVMPIDDWVRAFAENKWRGYIFTWPKFRQTVFHAANVVLKTAYKIEINEYARLLCKMD